MVSYLVFLGVGLFLIDLEESFWFNLGMATLAVVASLLVRVVLDGLVLGHWQWNLGRRLKK